MTDRIKELEAQVAILEGQLFDARMDIEQERLKAAEYKDMYDTKLNFYNGEIQRLITEVERTAKPAEFYLAMQKIILDTPALQEDWQRLCLMMNLTDSGFSKL